MSTPDRLYIDIKARAIISKMETTNFLNTTKAKNREIIMYAISRGINSPSQIEGKKDGYVNDKDLSFVDEALIIACIIPTLTDLEEITDKSLVYDYVQRCSNMGFKLIENEIEHHNIENIDRCLLVDLDEYYDSLGIN